MMPQTAAAPMSVLDRVTESMRRRVERWLPWYDVAAERRRTAHTEAIRQRSIAVRKRTEKRLEAIGVSYRRADGVLRHPKR